MCEELRATMAHNLDYTQWMTSATRQHAISKVTSIEFVIAEQNQHLIENWSKESHVESYTAVVVNLLELRAWREWIKLVLRDNQFRNEVPQSSLEVHYDPIFNTVDGHQQFSQRDGHQHGGDRSFLQGVSRLHEKIRRGVRAQQSQELGPDPKPAVLHLICYDLVRERSSDVPTCFRHDHVDTVVSDEGGDGTGTF